MQAISILVTVLVAAVCAAQAHAADTVSESREIAGFSGVTFSLPGQLILTQGDAVAVRVSATPELLGEIVTQVTDGVLEIRHSLSPWDFARDGDVVDDVLVEVTFVTLERLTMSGSGNAKAATVESESLDAAISGSATVQLGALSAGSVSVAISGSGEMNIGLLDAGTLVSSISGSGSVEVAGRVDAQSISISGNGDHSATSLQSKVVHAVVSGSGDVEVWATETLDAVIAGSGDVSYVGEPEVSERIAGSGSVRQRTLEI